ncbi:MAG: group II intron reverse transcriptase/maturase [Dehalococcoidales bacterium]|nr:group II intron reverse transcriptase/maturase [Dehalococcoidales bacterium]
MNTGASWPEPKEAELRVLAMQRKLHRWAVDPGRRFDDLFNLVCDPCFLIVAWSRVRSNKGARTAGVDGVAPRTVRVPVWLLSELREDLKARTFAPSPVREKRIPKTGGKVRRLGIPTTRDRVVQAALKLVLEPIFEVDFKPCSYGFRPRRRAQDAIAEIHYLASPNRNYEWVFEADITACFDAIDHTALMTRARRRIKDKRILALVTAFLKAGILSEEGVSRETITGTPQGGILSPLLANIAFSVPDEHFAVKWEALGPDWKRIKHRRRGGAVHRLVRYADDFVVMVVGSRADAEALRREVGNVLSPMGLSLSEHKTRVCHIDEGFDFLGWHIQRRRQRGRGGKRAVYTYPSKKALAAQSWTRCGCSRVENGIERSPTCCADQPGAAGLVCLLPPRCVVANVSLPRSLRLLADRDLDSQATPEVELDHDPTSLSHQLGDQRRRHDVLPNTGDQHRPLPLSRCSDRYPLGEHGMILWRAGCDESRTSGSEGGPEKPTDR